MDNDEIRISDLLYTVFKHRKTILVLGLLGFFCGFVFIGVSFLRNSRTNYAVNCSVAITSQPSADGVVYNNSDYLSSNTFYQTLDMMDAATFVMKSERTLQTAIDHSGLASILVFIVVYFILGLELNFSIVLAALASATAPASTVMTIRQTHAKGDFVETLLQVVALDDVVGLLAYSIAISVALASMTGTFQAGHIVKPIVLNIAVFLLGGLFGVFLKLLLHKRSTDNRLIVSVALLFAFCGICAVFDVSPLLGCMSMSMVYINLTDDERLFKQLNYFNPPILLLFFVRSGVNFNLSALVNSSESIGSVSLLHIGVVYFLVRIIGKYAGAFIGCAIAGKDKLVRNYLGLALIPQAGVAIGLAAMGARTLGGETGNILETVILASSVLYELIGPACAKLSLYLSKSYSNKLEEIVEIPEEEGAEQKTELELLIQRIQAIQEELPKHDDPFYEDEKAFSEAAEEHYAMTGIPNPNLYRRKRGAF